MDLWRARQELSATCRSRWHRRFLHSLLEAFSPKMGTILSEHMKMSKHEEGALFHQYDLNFYKMIDHKELDALLGIRVVKWVLRFNPVEMRICCKISKLAGSIWKARAGQSAFCLSSFFHWPMMSSSVCPLPKSRKWRKHSEATESVMMFERLETENWWEQLKSGKLHTVLCTWNNCVTGLVFHLGWLAYLDS